MVRCKRECLECSLYLNCQGCSYCEVNFCRMDCRRCSSLCPKRPGAFAHLKQLGGGLVELRRNAGHGLPPLIPVIPDRLTEQMETGPVIGIHGGNLCSSNGENIARVYRRKGIEGALNLTHPAKYVLHFYVKDRTLEGLWDQRHQIYSQLKKFQWEVIVSPNFSVYEDAPRIDHLYNIKRSSIVYNEMLDAGLPAVPDISWYNRIDLDQWIREINDKKLRCIAFSFQTVGVYSKASNTYLHYVMGFKYLIDRIPGDVEVILAGIVSPKRIAALKRECSNPVSVLNQTAYVQSRRGILSEGYLAAPPEMSKNEIFQRNLEFYAREYERGDEDA